MPAIRKASEAHFHSVEDVTRYMREAHGIVSALDFDDDLREAAFGKAVDLLAQKQVTFEQVSPSGVLLGNGQGL